MSINTTLSWIFMYINIVVNSYISNRNILVVVYLACAQYWVVYNISWRLQQSVTRSSVIIGIASAALPTRHIQTSSKFSGKFCFSLLVLLFYDHSTHIWMKGSTLKTWGSFIKFIDAITRKIHKISSISGFHQHNLHLGLHNWILEECYEAQWQRMVLENHQPFGKWKYEE